MKIKQKKDLTLGELVAAACQAWGARRAEKMVRWAALARLVVFREPARAFASSAKGRSV
jgi:hypothetical protein